MGVPEGQRPTDAQFVQQLMLSLLGMACFNSERMLEWAAEAFDWFAAVLMPNPVRDCCLIRTNIVCVRVGPYCISICTRHVNALYFLYALACRGLTICTLLNVGLYGDRTYTRPGGLARGRA